MTILFRWIALLALMLAPLAPATAGSAAPIETCAMHHAAGPTGHHDGAGTAHSCCIAAQALPDRDVVTAPPPRAHLVPVKALIEPLAPLSHPEIDLPPPRRG
ncbi:MAG: hypothetical protein ABR588_11810 [Sphingomicrobium sp.]|nr:hypothetical protein [Sphingomonadales bacterium]